MDKKLVHLLTKETPVDYFGVIGMLIAFTGMVFSLFLILFVNSTIAFPLCILLYIGIAGVEIRHRIYSPITLSLCFFYMVLYGFFLVDSPYIAYFGLMIFGWLTALSIFCLLIKKPLTLFCTSGKGNLRLHYIISILWLAAYLLSLLFAYLLMPSLWYLFLPALICFAACAISIYLSLFDLTFITRREKRFTLGAFDFKEIELESPEYEDYIKFYPPILKEALSDGRETVEELTKTLRKLDREKRRVLFAAYHEEKLIGCIGVSLDKKGVPLAFEEESGCSADPMRALGRIAILGRYGIAMGYRERTDVLIGLFKAALEYSFEEDVAYVGVEIFKDRLMLHLRLGFEHLFPHGDPRFTLVHPSIGEHLFLLMNLAGRVFFYKKGSRQKVDIFWNLNMDLPERWVKRQVIRHLFSPKEKCLWLHTIASIRYIMGITKEASEKR